MSLESGNEEKGIGFTTDTELQIKDHIHIEINKANMTMEMIKRSLHTWKWKHSIFCARHL